MAAVAGAAGGVGFVRDVHERDVEYIDDMLVVEGVKNVFALSATFY